MNNIAAIRADHSGLIGSYNKDFLVLKEDNPGYDMALILHRITDKMSQELEFGLITGSKIEGNLKNDLCKYINKRFIYSACTVVSQFSSHAATEQQTELMNAVAGQKDLIGNEELFKEEVIKMILEAPEYKARITAGESKEAIVATLEEGYINNQIDEQYRGLSDVIKNTEAMLDSIEEAKDPKNAIKAIFEFMVKVENEEDVFAARIAHIEKELLESVGKDLQLENKEMVVKDILVDLSTRNLKNAGYETIISDTWMLITYLNLTNTITLAELFDGRYKK